MHEPPPGWKLRRVDEVGDVQLGRQRSPDQVFGLHIRPYLRVANVFDGRIDYSDILKMNFTPTEFELFSLKPNDILLNEGQSLDLVGRCAIYDGPPGMCFQNTLIRFRPHAVLPQFAQAVFRYWLDTGEFRNIATQTTSIAHLGAERFGAMLFPLAPLAEQRRIADILTSVDDRIRAQEKSISKIEAQYKGLLEQLVLHRSAHFPRVTDRSSDALMRARWRSVQLGNTGTWLSGGTPSTDNPRYWNGEIPWISAASLRGFRISDSLRRITRLGAHSGTQLVPAGSVVFVVRGMSLKSEFRVGVAQRQIAFGQDCKAIVPIPEIHGTFLAMAIKARTSEILAMVDEAGHGTGRLPTDLISRLEISVPPMPEQQRIIGILEKCDQILDRMQAELKKLRSVKYGFMHDLISGRVRVPMGDGGRE